MYFYATRRDKKGNKLVTSYGKQEQAKKYGGVDASIEKTLYFLDQNGRPTKEDTGIILRSKLEGKPSNGGDGGRFVLYQQDGDRFIPTTYRFSTYGTANNAMKTMVDTFGTLVVVEEVEVGSSQEEEQMVMDEAPF